MYAVAETERADDVGHNDREITEVLGAMVVLAEAYRRWSAFGPDSRIEVVEALTGMLEGNRRVKRAVEALLAEDVDAS
jgi:hypothetical protein